MFTHSKSTAPAVATDRFLTIGEAAAKYRVSISGLRLWTRQGRLRCFRKGGSALSHRVFREADLIEFFSRCGNYPEESREGSSADAEGPSVALVARVSTSAQSADLARQAGRLEQWIENRWKGKAKVEKFVAVRSGLNFDASSFVNLIQRIVERRYQYLVVTHRERLARTAFNLINTLCRLHGTEIIVTESEGESDPQRELVSDLLAITHFYSTKLYASRSAKTNSIPLADDVVSQIVELHAAGHSQNVIFDTLKKAGKHKGEDGREFSIHVVRRVIRKHAKLAPVLAGSSALTSPAFSVPRSKRVSTFSLFWSENIRLGTPAAKLSRRVLIKSYRQWCGTKGLVSTTPKLITKWLRLRFPNVLANQQKNEDGEIIYSGVWIRQSP